MPDCYLHEFRDYGALYQLRFWSRTYFDQTRLEGTVRERMWYHLRRAGIAIPFPDGGSVYSVAPTLLPVEKDQLASNEKNLYQSGFFVRLQPGRDLSVGIAPAAIAHLISMLRSRIYGPGETLFHQREAGHHGYIVVRGELTGITVYEGVGTTQEFRIGPGELVGEMALLTDLPRSATVQAGTVEVELLELSREAFDVLRSLSPDIQRAIDEHTASRARELLEHLSPLPGQPDSPAPHDPAHPSAASCPTGSRMVTSSPPSGRFRA
jgi:CRP-like cAMP-binding protein